MNPLPIKNFVLCVLVPILALACATGSVVPKKTAGKLKPDARLIYISRLHDSTVPHFEKAQLGEIQVPEEGNEKSASRVGYVPTGKKNHFLKEPDVETLKNWSQALCASLVNLDQVVFPLDSWPGAPEKDCALKKQRGFLISEGEFDGHGVIEAELALNDPLWARAKVAALIKLDSHLRAQKVLKTIGGWDPARGDSSGYASLQFATDKEIVFMVHGYVSEWQILFKKTSILKDLEFVELK